MHALSDKLDGKSRLREENRRYEISRQRRNFFFIFLAHISLHGGYLYSVHTLSDKLDGKNRLHGQTADGKKWPRCMGGTPPLLSPGKTVPGPWILKRV